MKNLGFLVFQTLSSTALLVLIYVFYRLSQHLGEALQMKQYYQLFVIGAIFIVFSMLIQFYILLNMPLTNYQLSQFNRLIISSITLMALGVTFSFVGVPKYWGWLIKEIF